MEIRDVLDRHAKNKNEEEIFFYLLSTLAHSHTFSAHTNLLKTNRQKNKDNVTTNEHDAIARQMKHVIFYA